ncbi:hypothetical protein BCQ_0459 [Bacillus cereus Q1]|uniref:Uncharacterized protein n=1 Tax=Bacillus cereus (strain Q1) TaxID=361100 RepID=B9J2L2_BACCQ|nr:hypothetical protein BCQ_0459 [Bacillus cereus Q1]
MMVSNQEGGNIIKRKVILNAYKKSHKAVIALF